MGPQPPGKCPGRLGPGRKNSKLPLDNFPRSAIIAFVPRGGHENLAGLCKGSTTDSDSVCEGSNPSPAAKTKGHPKGCPFVLAFSARLRAKCRRCAAAVLRNAPAGAARRGFAGGKTIERRKGGAARKSRWTRFRMAGRKFEGSGSSWHAS